MPCRSVAYAYPLAAVERSRELYAEWLSVREIRERLHEEFGITPSRTIVRRWVQPNYRPGRVHRRPEGATERALQMRAEGAKLGEIRWMLARDFGITPDRRTIHRWLTERGGTTVAR